jgi:hypothetical protein
VKSAHINLFTGRNSLHGRTKLPVRRIVSTPLLNRGRILQRMGVDGTDFRWINGPAVAVKTA